MSRLIQKLKKKYPNSKVNRDKIKVGHYIEFEEYFN